MRPFEPLNMDTAKWADILPVDLPIDILIPTQETLYEGELPEGHSFCGDQYPHVVLYQAKFFISDGHNRIHRRKLKGQKIIKARLLIKYE
jgi:hypothetical protein